MTNQVYGFRGYTPEDYHASMTLDGEIKMMVELSMMCFNGVVTGVCWAITKL